MDSKYLLPSAPNSQVDSHSARYSLSSCSVCGSIAGLVLITVHLPFKSLAELPTENLIGFDPEKVRARKQAKNNGGAMCTRPPFMVEYVCFSSLCALNQACFTECRTISSFDESVLLPQALPVAQGAP